MKVPEPCSAMQRHFEHVNSELRTGNDLLLLDIIGNVANGLFGVLDSKYATEMSGTIRKVKSNVDYLLNLLQNQTSVIDSTINIIKRDEATIENQMKLMEQQMNDMTKVQNNAVKALQWYITLTTQMTVIAGTIVACNEFKSKFPEYLQMPIIAK